MKRAGIIIIFCLLYVTTFAQQQFTISGTVSAGDEPAVHATITLAPSSPKKLSNDNGFFRFAKLPPGNYQLAVSLVGYVTYQKDIVVTDKNVVVDIRLVPSNNTLEEVTVTNKNESVSGKLKDVSGTAIYAGKKTEVINLKNINANLAANNSRQIYARVPGLNIWEYSREVCNWVLVAVALAQTVLRISTYDKTDMISVRMHWVILKVIIHLLQKQWTG